MAAALELYHLTHPNGATRGSLKYAGEDWIWSQNASVIPANAPVMNFNITQSQNSQGKNVWSRAFFSLPWTITMTGLTASQNTVGAVTLKSGNWNLIDSMVLVFNGKGINNNTSLQNILQTIRTVVNADITRLSTSLPYHGFFLDTPETNIVQSTGANYGFYNNKIIGASSNNAPSCTGGWTSLFPQTNQGLIAKLRAQAWGGDGVMTTTAAAQNLYANTSATSLTTNTTQVATGVAIVPLADLCDFFSERNLGLPLGNCSLVANLNVNQGSVSISTAGFAAGIVTAFNMTQSTCPFIVTDAGLAALSGTTSTITLTLDSYNGSASQSRFYLPTVQLDPRTELQLKYPIKRLITFRDYQHFTLPGIGYNQSVTWQVSNTVAGLKRVFIVPFLSSQNQALGLNSWGSPFSACPGMMDTNILLQNVNMKVNGRNIFQQNMLYQYEQFTQMIQTQMLNGDTLPYTAGSLLSLPNWLRGQGVYIFDLTSVPNLLAVEPSTPVDCIFQCTVALATSALKVDFHAFCEVDVSVEFTETGNANYSG